MKEYRIVVKNGNSKSYSLWSFDNFDVCYGKLLELIIEKSKCVNKFYYVTNKFYKNEYEPLYPNMTYFTIECRNVNEWKVLDKVIENTNNNIILFKKGS